RWKQTASLRRPWPLGASIRRGRIEQRLGLCQRRSSGHEPATRADKSDRRPQRLPSPSGAPRSMSRQELADAVNAYLYREHGVKDKLNQDHIGKIERGYTRWPGKWRRLGLRAVLGAAS